MVTRIRTPRGAWMAIALTTATCAAAAAGCKPNIDETTSLVTTPRILAVRSEPAEVPPDTPVTLSALYVDASGSIANAPIDWAFCDDRKPLVELGPVSPRCLQREGDWFEQVGVGPQVTGSLPKLACRNFGPEVPPVIDKEPAGRPVDPDPTGGFYQPIRVDVMSSSGEEKAIGRTRITCGVVGPSSDQLAELKQRSHPNVNPAIDSLHEATLGDLAPDDASPSQPNAVTAGQRLALRALWATCAEGAPSCTGAESYASFDVGAQAIIGRREAMRVSWFATGGAFEHDHTGRNEGESDSFSENEWTAPSQASTVHLWLVVRDDRGGVGWRAFTIQAR
jgi:hypothetical protein